MPESTPFDPHIIRADSVASDGTIAGLGTDSLVFWHPGTQAWEWAPRPHDAGVTLISPDGSSIVTTFFPQRPDPVNVVTWNRTDGWQALSGSTVAQSVAINVSRNFRFVVGAGNNNGEAAQAWVWAMDGGVQQLLSTPQADGVVAALAGMVSDDGNVVIGNAIRPAEWEGFFYEEYVATRWMGGGSPTILRDPDGNELYEASACNDDCSIVFGTGVWFLKDDGEFGFLGKISDGYPTPGPFGPYYATDASSDGSVVVGVYSAKEYPGLPNSESYVDRPFVWTRETGMASLRSMEAILGIRGNDWDQDDWGYLANVRVSPDGRLILISGEHVAGLPGGWADDRVVVVHLTPKAVRPTGGHSTHAAPTPPRAGSNGSARMGNIVE